MNVLVVGSAQCVWDDLRALGGVEIGATIAINRMVRDYPSMPTYGASVHHEHVMDYVREGVPMVCPKLVPGVDLAYDQLPYRRGTSGLYGVGFALLIGAIKVICAGIPVDVTPHYYPGPGIGPDVQIHRDRWMECRQALEGRVFSLSGWTREMLGSPL